MPKNVLQALLEPVWTGEQPLTPVYRPLEKETDQPEHIADGFCYTVTLSTRYKCLDENEISTKVNAILEHHNVVDLLNIEIIPETTTVHKRAYGQRTAKTVTTTTVTVNTSRDVTAYTNTVRNLGWKVFVCNDLELNLTEVVLAYRDEYIIERGFNRFRGKTLGITPLFLSSITRIKGELMGSHQSPNFPE